MRMGTALVISLLLVLSVPEGALAAPPPNDNLVNATTISGDEFTGTNVEATRQGGEPHNDFLPGTPGTDEASVWFKWTPPSTGLWTIDLCGPNTDFDTSLGAYSGNTFAGVFIPRRRNQDQARCEGAADPFASAITFNATGGSEYKISVAGQGETGPFKGKIHPGPNTSVFTTADTQLGFAQSEIAVAPRSIGTGATPSALSCALDGVPFSACPDPPRFSGLADGPHILRVKASAGGNEDPSAAVSVFTVDTSPPDTQLTSFTQPPDGSDATFAWGGTDAGSAFECSIDGTLPATCSSPDTYNQVCPGSHGFSVRARDLAFNYDPTAVEQPFAIAPGPACANPEVGTLAPTSISPFSASAKGSLEANGSIVAAYFEYGTTAAYGAVTSPDLYAGDTPGATPIATIYGRPNEVLHYRLVARTGTGLVFASTDMTVTLDPAPVGGAELQIGSPTATATTVDLPYTASYAGPDDVVVGALFRAGTSAEPRWGDLQRLPGDNAAHSGVLRLSGLPPDTPIEIVAAVAVVENSSRNRLEPPITTRTLALPAAEPPAEPPANPPANPPAAPGPVIERLRFDKAKLHKLRKGRWEARVRCTAACSLRFRVKKGETIVAKAKKSRSSAGDAVAKLKLTKKGRKRLRGAERLKAKLVVHALDPQGDVILALKQKLTFK